MKNNISPIHRLFRNTKFLIAFSIVCAVIIWAVIAIAYAPTTDNVIKNVPVTIDLENSVPDKCGLEIFGQKDFKVDVTVSGSRYVVGGNLLSPDDFEVTAQTAYVTSAGTHALQLKVTSKNPNAEYTIVGLSQETVEVYFDEYSEKDFNVEVRNVSNIKSVVPTGYMTGDYMLDDETVTVSGASLQIAKIAKIYADISIDKQLVKSTSYNGDIVAVDLNLNNVNYIQFDGEDKLSVPVSVPIYKIMNLQSKIQFKNIPSVYLTDLPSYTCTPSSAKVAVIQNGSDDDALNVGTVSFSSLKAGNNEFNFSADSIEGIKVLDSTKSFKVSVSMKSNITIKSMSLSSDNISIKNADDDYTYKITSDDIKVNVEGTSAGLNKISNSDIYAKIDLSKEKIKSGKNTVDLSVALKNSSECWVYGSYTVTFSATKK